MLEELKEKIKDKSLVIFGEIHGTKEIPELLSRFFVEIAKDEEFNICFEIPTEFQEKISLFMRNGDDNLLRNSSFFSKNKFKDGRNSIEYLNLIKSLYDINLKNKMNIEVFCIDSIANNQKEKEEGLAENILKSLQNKKTFAILGSIHASKKPIQFKGIYIIPAGNILFKKLNNKMFNINILPNKGHFFNFGIKKIVGDYNKHFNEGFDYILKIEHITPCSFLKD
ncbi:MAG: hypothetical protein KJ767_01645 [Nanoarchaeota archaeon]|nr:hypothetical protein [Nanoarchaeota archaeon]